MIGKNFVEKQQVETLIRYMETVLNLERNQKLTELKDSLSHQVNISHQFTVEELQGHIDRFKKVAQIPRDVRNALNTLAEEIQNREGKENFEKIARNAEYDYYDLFEIKETNRNNREKVLQKLNQEREIYDMSPNNFMRERCHEAIAILGNPNLKAIYDRARNEKDTPRYAKKEEVRQSPRERFYNELSEIIGTNFASLNLEEQAKKIYEFRGASLIRALDNYLQHDPLYLHNLALNSKESALSILRSTNLGPKLSNKALAEILIKFRNELSNQNLIDKYINDINSLLKPSGRSVKTLLEDSSVKPILFEAQRFQQYAKILQEQQEVRRSPPVVPRQQHHDKAVNPSAETQLLKEQKQIREHQKIASKAEHNYYELFDLDKTDNAEEINRKLKRAKVNNMRDKENPLKQDKVQEINARIDEANAIFNDPSLRAIYDAGLAAKERGRFRKGF